MSFFKKLKKNIGVDGEEKAKKAEKAPVQEKEPEITATLAVASVNEPSLKKEKKSFKVEKVAGKTKKPSKTLPQKETEKEALDWLEQEGQLAVDVYQTEDEFCVEAPIAGVEPENIDVYVENGLLVIKGERKQSKEESGKNYFYQECYWGAFSRKISLPEDVDSSKVKATLKKGILRVTIPRAEKAKKKKVNIVSEE